VTEATRGSFFDLLTARPGSKKATRYGRFAVPGEATTELPDGRVRVYYDEVIDLRNDEGGFDAPDDLEVTVVDAATGAAVPIRLKPADQVSSSAKRAMARSYVGRFETPKAGAYVIRATVGQASPNDPHLSLG
jgi:hypothetical protein